MKSKSLLLSSLYRKDLGEIFKNFNEINRQNIFKTKKFLFNLGFPVRYPAKANTILKKLKIKENNIEKEIALFYSKPDNSNDIITITKENTIKILMEDGNIFGVKKFLFYLGFKVSHANNTDIKFRKTIFKKNAEKKSAVLLYLKSSRANGNIIISKENALGLLDEEIHLVKCINCGHYDDSLYELLGFNMPCCDFINKTINNCMNFHKCNYYYENKLKKSNYKN
uniref:hypothetical protein n=1 Tax=Clostridioides sp. ES-S-0173-01 TaxID=2770786 RepID=UPI001E3219CE|nr:hypothetical protein [Clostridioides sp. ES-S-0173-01]UDN49479.1 hypothetical protein JJJ25_19380 [Clostridioides sp. ES-S-0173-01]